MQAAYNTVERRMISFFSSFSYSQLTTKQVLPGKIQNISMIEVMSIWYVMVYNLMLMTLPTNSHSTDFYLLHTTIACHTSFKESLTSPLPIWCWSIKAHIH